MSFKKNWLETVQSKNSQLCVGLDLATSAQRDWQVIPAGQDKVSFGLAVIQAVAPYAAAVKINHQYVRDLGQEAIKQLTAAIHAGGMLAIDDAKVADIGSTNSAAFYHIAAEGFDAATYAPFPGNIEESVASAHGYGLGLISLALMSNPEFAVMHRAEIGGIPGSYYFAKRAAAAGADGLVVGAPSAQNRLAAADIRSLAPLCGDALILMPGLGTQGGDSQVLIDAFGNRVIANVGREVVYSQDPGAEARKWRDHLREQAAQRQDNNRARSLGSREFLR